MTTWLTHTHTDIIWTSWYTKQHIPKIMDEGVCPCAFLILSFLPITTTLPVLTVLSPGQLSSITLFLLQHCSYFFTIPLLAVCWVMAVVISVFCSGIVACYRLLVCSAQPFQLIVLLSILLARSASLPFPLSDCYILYSSFLFRFLLSFEWWLLFSILLVWLRFFFSIRLTWHFGIR